MADLMAQVAAQKDRITKILDKDTDIEQIGNAALQAYGGQGGTQSFGNLMNAAKANRIKNELSLQNVLFKEKDAQQRDRRLDQQDETHDLNVDKFAQKKHENEWRETKDRAEGNNATAQGLIDAKDYFPGMKPKDASDIHEAVKNRPDLDWKTGKAGAMRIYFDEAKKRGLTPADEASRLYAKELSRGKARRATDKTPSQIRNEQRAKFEGEPQLKNFVMPDGRVETILMSDYSALQAVLGRGGVMIGDSATIRATGLGGAKDKNAESGPYVYDDNGMRIGREFKTYPGGVPTRVVATVGADGKPTTIPWQKGFQSYDPGTIAKMVMSGSQFANLNAKLNLNRRGIVKLKKYAKTVKDGTSGWKTPIAKFANAMKGLANVKINNMADFNLAMQTPKIAGLVGSIKDEVLGGGVLSDQDVVLLFSAVGGPAGMFRNIDVTMETLRNIVEDKIEGYNNEVPQFNMQADFLKRGDRLERISVDDLDKAFGKSKLNPAKLSDAVPPEERQVWVARQLEAARAALAKYPNKRVAILQKLLDEGIPIGDL